MKAVGGACLAVCIALYLVIRPPVDGILFARGQTVHLVVPGADGAAAFTSPRGRSLSDFLADNAARSLAQGIDPRTRRRAFTLFQHADGREVAVVTSRGLLSAACRSAAKLVIATVRADYPCRDDACLLYTSPSPRDNYLLLFRGDTVSAQASDGQYFLIKPVRRP